jgi:hypothetical protein
MVPKTSNSRRNGDAPPVPRAPEQTQLASKDAAVRIARAEEKRRLEEREERGWLARLAAWMPGRRRER